MLFILNVALVALAAFAGVASIFGDTWSEKKLTKTGWFALICWIGAFAVGITREFLVKSESDRTEAIGNQRFQQQSEQLTLALKQLDKSDKQLGLIGSRTENLERMATATAVIAKPVVEKVMVPNGIIELLVVQEEDKKPIKGAIISVLEKDGTLISLKRTEEDGKCRLVLDPAIALSDYRILISVNKLEVLLLEEWMLGKVIEVLIPKAPPPFFQPDASGSRVK
jgi:hypothetical protein